MNSHLNLIKKLLKCERLTSNRATLGRTCVTNKKQMDKES